MKIIPLSVPRINWKDFIEVTQEVLGISPTRGLDANNIKLDSPAAFPACLTFDNKPVEALANSDAVLRHSYATFMIVGSRKEITWIATRVCLERLYKSGEDESFIVLSGNMLQWKQEIVWALREHSYAPKYIRDIFDQLLCAFKKAGYEIWTEYERVDSHSQGVTLRRSKNR